MNKPKNGKRKRKRKNYKNGTPSGSTNNNQSESTNLKRNNKKHKKNRTKSNTPPIVSSLPKNRKYKKKVVPNTESVKSDFTFPIQSNNLSRDALIRIINQQIELHDKIRPCCIHCKYREEKEQFLPENTPTHTNTTPKSHISSSESYEKINYTDVEYISDALGDFRPVSIATSVGTSYPDLPEEKHETPEPPPLPELQPIVEPQALPICLYKPQLIVSPEPTPHLKTITKLKLPPEPIIVKPRKHVEIVSIPYAFDRFFQQAFERTFCNLVPEIQKVSDSRRTVKKDPEMICSFKLESRSTKGGPEFALEENTKAVLKYMAGYYELPQSSKIFPNFNDRETRNKCIPCPDAKSFTFGQTKYKLKDFYGMAIYKVRVAFLDYAIYVRTSPFQTPYRTSGMPIIIFDKIVTRLIGNDHMSTKGAGLVNNVIRTSTVQYKETESWVVHYLKTESSNIVKACTKTVIKMPTNNECSKVHSKLNRSPSIFNSIYRFCTKVDSRQTFKHKTTQEKYMLQVGKSIGVVPDVKRKQSEIKVKECFEIKECKIFSEAKPKPIYALYPYIPANWLLHENSPQNILYAMIARQGRKGPKINDDYLTDFAEFVIDKFIPLLPTVKKFIPTEEWIDQHSSWSESKKNRFKELAKKMRREKYMNLKRDMSHRSAFVKRELINKIDPDSPPRLITVPNESVICATGPIFKSFADECKFVFTVKDPLVMTSGLSKEATGTPLNEYFKTHDIHKTKFFSNDYSKFDASISPQLLEIEQMLYEAMLPKGLFDDEREIMLEHMLSNRFAWKYHVGAGTDDVITVTLMGTRRSGDANTSLGNTLLNLAFNMWILARNVVNGKPMPITDYKILCNGDDSFGMFPDKFILDPDNTNSLMENLGIKCTLEQSNNYWNLPYCSGFFVNLGKDTNNNNFVLHSSVARILSKTPLTHTISRQDTRDQVLKLSIDKLRSARNELRFIPEIARALHDLMKEKEKLLTRNLNQIKLRIPFKDKFMTWATVWTPDLLTGVVPEDINLHYGLDKSAWQMIADQLSIPEPYGMNHHLLKRLMDVDMDILNDFENINDFTRNSL
jgi:hypothetical protein